MEWHTQANVSLKVHDKVFEYLNRNVRKGPGALCSYSEVILKHPRNSYISYDPWPANHFPLANNTLFGVCPAVTSKDELKMGRFCML